jgi:hypothetical protein
MQVRSYTRGASRVKSYTRVGKIKRIKSIMERVQPQPRHSNRRQQQLLMRRAKLQKAIDNEIMKWERY